MRFHPSLIKLKKYVQKSDKKHKINLIYQTERYSNYFNTWKGNKKKSGGIILNIGVHFFDLMIWIFGNVLKNKIFYNKSYKARGILYLKKGEVNWNLSVKTVKKNIKPKVKRFIKIDEKILSFQILLIACMF